MEENYKILITDDEPDILSLLEKALKLEGFNNVIKAQNGTDAVELCKTENPDAVILDIMMPKMDGITALKNMRSRSALRCIQSRVEKRLGYVDPLE